MMGPAWRQEPGKLPLTSISVSLPARARLFTLSARATVRMCRSEQSLRALISSVPPPCGPQTLNSGHRVWEPVPWHIELSGRVLVLLIQPRGLVLPKLIGEGGSSYLS